MLTTVPGTEHVFNSCYHGVLPKDEAGSHNFPQIRIWKKGSCREFDPWAPMGDQFCLSPPPLMRCVSTQGMHIVFESPRHENEVSDLLFNLHFNNVLGLWVTQNYSETFWTMPMMEWVLWNCAFGGDITWKLSATLPQRYQEKLHYLDKC